MSKGFVMLRSKFVRFGCAICCRITGCGVNATQSYLWVQANHFCLPLYHKFMPGWQLKPGNYSSRIFAEPPLHRKISQASYLRFQGVGKNQEIWKPGELQNLSNTLDHFSPIYPCLFPCLFPSLTEYSIPLMFCCPLPVYPPTVSSLTLFLYSSQISLFSLSHCSLLSLSILLPLVHLRCHAPGHHFKNHIDTLSVHSSTLP
jgi:hypothetical protein